VAASHCISDAPLILFLKRTLLMTEVKEHRDVPTGAPKISYHDEGGLNSSNAAGGQVKRDFEPGWQRAKRGENSAPPV
jgi:hypothetical protein